MKKLVLLLSFAFLPVAPGSSEACDYEGRPHFTWRPYTSNVFFTVCRVHFAEGSKARIDLEDAMTEFNSIHNSRVTFIIYNEGDHQDYESIVQDGFNFIDIVNIPVGAAALTLWHHDNSEIVETDIVFDTTATFSFGDPKGWAIVDWPLRFKSVALHELSHVLGFLDYNDIDHDTPSVLGDNHGGWVGDRKVGLLPFDIGHVRYHYAETQTMIRPMPDLVLSNYHTEYYLPSDRYELRLNEGLSRGAANWGDTVRVSWTRFNNGNAAITEDYNTRIYFSTDDKLSANDVLATTFRQTATVNPHSVFAASRNVTVPSGLSGAYHVLVQIDSSNEISELNESNNVIPIHKEIMILP